MKTVWFNLRGERAWGQLIYKGLKFWHVKLNNGDIIRRHIVKHRCKEIK